MKRPLLSLKVLFIFSTRDTSVVLIWGNKVTLDKVVLMADVRSAHFSGLEGQQLLL